MEDDRVPKKILDIGSIRIWKTGRPRRTWLQEIEEIGTSRG